MDIVREVVIAPTYYVINGKKYDRLSHVLKSAPNPGLEAWKAKVGEEEAGRLMREAAEYGTEVHALMAFYANGLIGDYLEYGKKCSKEVVKCAEAGVEWMQKYVSVVLGVEVVLWSDKYGIAGSCDLVARLNWGANAIIDWKTGSLWETVGMQLYAYREMWGERYGERPDKLFAVNLPRKNPGKRLVKEYNVEDMGREFEKLMEDWDIGRI